jgi:hypothetical protein
MAIEIRHTPVPPVEPRQAKLRAVPTLLRRPQLVSVQPAPGQDGRWVCHCLCGWTSRRLEFRDEGHASRAAAQHVRVCPLLSH